jgi:hypothetical protein
VHYAAAALGVSILHYSALEIVSEVASNTQLSLGAVFENAKLRSPCVLLISHVDVLSQSAQHSSSQVCCDGFVSFLFCLEFFSVC